MSRISFYLGVIFCLLFAFRSLYAMTPEQKSVIHEHFEKVGIQCIKDNPVSQEDIGDLRAKKVPAGDNAPCFMACMMKQLGIMDESGMLQKDTTLDLAKKVFSDDEELKTIEDYIHSCSHINNESVGDGEKGCERAMLSYKCMLDNASKFGFDI